MTSIAQLLLLVAPLVQESTPRPFWNFETTTVHPVRVSVPLLYTLVRLALRYDSPLMTSVMTKTD